MIKTFLSIAYVFLVLAGITGLLAFVHDARNKTICKQLNIEIQNSNEAQFIDNEEIEKILKEQGLYVIGNKLQNINIPKLEKILNAHPHIKDAQVFTDLNGDVNISILQRKPVVRIINVYNESYYIDEDGWLMPTSAKYVARVPIANGLIFERFDAFYKINFADTLNYKKVFKSSLLDDLYLIGKMVVNDNLWQKQIQQIYVEKEIELIPRVGQQQIILGDASRLQEKLNKLKIFYTEAIPKVGWNKYSTINLKFKNQVVCTKAEKN